MARGFLVVETLWYPGDSMARSHRYHGESHKRGAAELAVKLARKPHTKAEVFDGGRGGPLVMTCTPSSRQRRNGEPVVSCTIDPKFKERIAKGWSKNLKTSRKQQAARDERMARLRWTKGP